MVKWMRQGGGHGGQGGRGGRVCLRLAGVSCGVGGGLGGAGGWAGLGRIAGLGWSGKEKAATSVEWVWRWAERTGLGWACGLGPGLWGWGGWIGGWDGGD